MASLRKIRLSGFNWGPCYVPSLGQLSGRIPYERGARLELLQNRQMVTKEPIGSTEIILRGSIMIR